MNNINSEILKLLNSWSHKRAQPFKIEELEKIITENVICGLPIPLFGYWGIGNKAKFDDSEINTVHYLKSMIENVRKIYAPGVKVNFILSDVHAKNNCIPDEIIQSYIKKMKELFSKNDFNSVLLSDLYRKHNLSIESVFQNENVDNKLWWEFFSLRKDLLKQAHNVSLCKDKNLSAKRYALIRMEESKILEKEFKNQIFMTYSQPHYRMLYPNLPTIYLYSDRKGSCAVPWFRKNSVENKPPN